MLVLALLCAFSLELCFFNFAYLKGLCSSWQPITIVQPYKDAQGETFSLLQSGTTSFGLPSLDGVVLKNVSFTFASEAHFPIKGRVLVKNELRRHLFTQGASFVAASTTEAFAKLSNQVRTYEVAITFDAPLPAPVQLKSLVLNQQPPLNFSWLRFSLIFLPLLALLFTLKYRVYEAEFDCGKPRHRRAYYLGTIPSFVLVLLVFYYNNPVTGHNAYVACSFPQECTFALGTPDHSLLRQRPQTQQEIYQSHLYDQQFDAFLKGRLSFDIVVDPKLSNMANPYEISNLYQAQVGYLFDRTYYKGQYYSYYGLTPVFMVYVPIYALTGKFPTPALTNLILAVFATAAMFAALLAVIEVMHIKANLLLLLLGSNAVVLGSGLLFLQGGLEHYFQAVTATIGWCCVEMWAVAKLYAAEGRRASLSWSAVVGLAVVMIALSRPNMVLLALCVLLPLLLRWRRAFQSHSRGYLGEIALMGVLMVFGCAGMLWYNYARFDNVLQFGQNIVLSAYDAAKTPLLSLYVFLDSLHHLFFADFDYSDEFPFITIGSMSFADAGNVRFGQYVVGIGPYWLSLGLLLGFYRLKELSAQDKALRAYLALIMVAATVVALFSFLFTNVYTQRYATELLFVFLGVSLLLLLKHIQYGQGFYQKLVYVGCAGAMVQTVVLGALNGAIGPQQFRLNVEGMVELINIFRPFA